MGVDDVSVPQVQAALRRLTRADFITKNSEGVVGGEPSRYAGLDPRAAVMPMSGNIVVSNRNETR